MSNITLKTIDSLQKVFLDTEPLGCEYKEATMLANETFHYQIAVKLNFDWRLRVYPQVTSLLKDNITLRRVANVPSELPAYTNHDDNVLRTQPGLFPDPLFVLDKSGIYGSGKLWYSLWVTVDSKGITTGDYPIKIEFFDEDGNNQGDSVFIIKILPKKSDEQSLIYTNWFHADCLYTYYHTKPFSKMHWSLIKNYMQAASAHGMNMILTPLFTPPLDTAIGGERPTVQLIDVFKDGKRYTFDFTRLKHWIKLAKACGIKYFELSHLFTQWGAKNAPKVMAYINGEEKQIFGWDTDATGDEYSHFLSVFLPILVLFIKENKLDSSVYFHVSDEPSIEHLENYRKAGDLLKKHIGTGFPIIDALSDYEFYKTGLVGMPIPATNHFEEFFKHSVKDLWAYYCCGQYKEVSNRFFSMPSARNRILGIQLYKYDIKGFLQWGYNFWYTQYSLSRINPYLTTDAGAAFPSGDSFEVYPGEDGTPVISLRLEVFNDALQDLRALQTLEKKIGREEVIKIIEAGLENPISMTKYPQDSEWLLKKREEINLLLAK